MKVSIVMGLYNCESTLRESLDSLLNQTYKDYEIIMCDDCSQDNTSQIAQEYISKHPHKFTLLANSENKGLAYSLNRCISLAKGIYIARMDADDISRIDRFEKQVEFLDRNFDYALVGSSAQLFDENGVWGKRQMKKKPQKKDFLFGSPFIHPTILIRKEILIKSGVYKVSKETLRTEDYDLFMRLYALNYKGFNIQEDLFLYREDNLSYKKRKYKYRIDEAKVRYDGFKKLELMPIGLVYVLKPLIVGLVPHKILKLVRRSK